ncbi:MAG TPA: hypothetical protein VNC50_21345 [Planctomycetia bacterium]|nr:hypothetical protein [Planctomycetia bacterium]
MAGSTQLLIGIGAAVSACAVLALAIRPLMIRRRLYLYRRYIRDFAVEREQLEAKFFDLASQTGEPSGWRWDGIEFDSSVSFVRDRSSGRVSALVEATIDLAPPEADAASEDGHEVQHATAVFHVRRGHWTTKGRIFYNMSPREALHRFHDRYEALSVASAP